MSSILAGDALKLTLNGKAGPAKLHALQQGGMRHKLKTRALTIYAPGGADPGIPANTVTILVGPNGNAGFPLRPGAALTLENINPSDVAFDSQGTAGQVAYVVYGGEPGAAGDPGG